DRPVEDPERGLARWIVLADLVRELPRPAGHLPGVGRSRADAGRALGLELDADDLALPLAVPLELVDVREDVLGPALDLDRFVDRCHFSSSVVKVASSRITGRKRAATDEPRPRGHRATRRDRPQTAPRG